MSAWSKKLTTKINALGDSSSKESIQTLAKWIGFNRKHAASAFVPVLLSTLREAPSAARQVTRLTVIHELLLLEKDSEKWDRLADLRMQLGEGVLLVVADSLEETTREKLRTSLIKEWDEANSFGGPTLIAQLRKKISRENDVAASAPAAESVAPDTDLSAQAPPIGNTSSSPAAKTESPVQDVKVRSSEEEKTEVQEQYKLSVNETTEDVTIPTGKVFATGLPNGSLAASLTTNTYDFEATGIPAAEVDPNDLLEPTRSIASLQIARDLRNDGAVQLSSLLAGLPENIKQSCTDQEQLSDDKARDYAMRTPDVLLDMDLEEQVQSVRMYRDIVKRQRLARKQLLRLLIQSRCQFGAEKAAEEFTKADRAQGELLKRKHILTDAMELEGLDVAETQTQASTETEYAPLAWYKKAKTEE
jgi:hypothetical protein